MSSTAIECKHIWVYYDWDMWNQRYTSKRCLGCSLDLEQGA